MVWWEIFSIKPSPAVQAPKVPAIYGYYDYAGGDLGPEGAHLVLTDWESNVR